MKDTDLYSQILGLTKPWFLEAVELNTAEEQVDIHVEHCPGVRWACPICRRDHAEPRVWRHLDTCQFKTFLHARIPQVDCPEHGILQVNVPWAESKGRFILLMERLIIDVLAECATLTGAPLHLRSDNGPEFVSKALLWWATNEMGSSRASMVNFGTSSCR